MALVMNSNTVVEIDDSFDENDSHSESDSVADNWRKAQFFNNSPATSTFSASPDPASLLTFADITTTASAFHIETTTAAGTKFAVEYASHVGGFGDGQESAVLDAKVELKSGAAVEIQDKAWLVGATAVGELVVAGPAGKLVLDSAIDLGSRSGTGQATLIDNDGRVTQAGFAVAALPSAPMSGGSAAAPSAPLWAFTLTDMTGKATTIQSTGQGVAGLLDIAGGVQRALRG